MRRALKGVRFIAVVTVVLLASLLTATVEMLFRYLARLAGQDVRLHCRGYCQVKQFGGILAARRHR